jgi:hypothetical protein
MNYFVIWPDGQKFGPATADVLTQWASEGRINRDTDLEIVETSERIKAGNVPEILFPGPTPQMGIPTTTATSQPAANPYANPIQSNPIQDNPVQQNPVQPQNQQVYNPYNNPYPRGTNYSGDDGSGDITKSYVFSVLTFLCGCLPLIIGSFVFASNAEKKGNPGAKTAKIVAFVILGLNIIGWIVYIAMFPALMAGGFGS